MEEPGSQERPWGAPGSGSPRDLVVLVVGWGLVQGLQGGRGAWVRVVGKARSQSVSYGYDPCAWQGPPVTAEASPAMCPPPPFLGYCFSDHSSTPATPLPPSPPPPPLHEGEHQCKESTPEGDKSRTGPWRAAEQSRGLCLVLKCETDTMCTVHRTQS